MIRTFTILTILLSVLHFSTSAQTRNMYTYGNTILVSIESTAGMYEYTSRELLVRYNENTEKVECLFNLNSLLPANDSSPVVIPQDIFFVAKYPELLIEIDSPRGNVQQSSAAPEANNQNREARMYFQGVPIEMRIPVTFNPDRRTLLFSTRFDFLLPDNQVTIPAKYIPVLTGRIIFTIRNAQWAAMTPR